MMDKTKYKCKNCGIEIYQPWLGKDQKDSTGWRHIEGESFYYQCRFSDSIAEAVGAEMMEESRPDIPKLEITNIGSFDSEGKPIYWVFDGKSHPHAVGIYYSDDWYLIGGYTVDELRAIKKGVEMTDKTDLIEQIKKHSRFVRYSNITETNYYEYPEQAITQVKQLCIESDEAREYWRGQDCDIQQRAVQLAVLVERTRFIEQACEAVDSCDWTSRFDRDNIKQAIRDRLK